MRIPNSRSIGRTSSSTGRSVAAAPRIDPGAGARALAQGVSDVGHEFDRRQAENDAFEIENTALDFEREADALYNKRVQGAQEGAEGFTDNFKKEAESLFNSTLNKASNPRLKENLRLRLKRQAGSFLERAEKFEKQESFAKKARVIDREVDNVAQSAIRQTGVSKYSISNDPRNVPLKGQGDINIRAAQLSSLHETGTTDLAKGSLQIANDTSGSKSYGVLGINSLERSGSAKQFAKENPHLGLTAKAGTSEFDEQWRAAARNNPDGLIKAQLNYHEKHILKPAKSQLEKAGFGGLSSDPSVLSFVADGNVQYGSAILKKHLNAAKGASSPQEFISRAAASMKANLNNDFRTYLSDNPNNKAGLENRIDNRVKNSLSLSDQLTSVPKWEGEIPKLSDAPNIAQRSESIQQLVATLDVPPSEKAKILDNARRKITTSWVRQLAQDNPSAALAVVRSGEYDDDLTIEDELALTGSAENSIAKLEKEIIDSQKQLVRQTQTQAKSLLKDELSSIRSTGQSVGVLTSDHLATLDEGDRRKLDVANREFQAVQSIKLSSPQEIEQQLNELKPEGVGFADEEVVFDAAKSAAAKELSDQASSVPFVDRQGFINRINDPSLRQSVFAESEKRQKAIRSDIVSAAVKSGIEVPELDFENLSQSVLDRYNKLSGFAQNNGVETSLLSSSEKLSFTENFKEIGVSQKMQVMENLSGLPSNAQAAFYNDISKQAPFLAHAGGVLSTGNSEAVGVALRGYQATTEGRKFEDLPKNDINLSLEDTGISSALRAMPDVLSDAQSFALNYARGVSQESGSAVTAEDYQKGLNLALGSEKAIHTHRTRTVLGFGGNSSKVILPADVDGDSFDDWFDGLTNDSIRSMNNGEIPVDIDGRELDAEYIQDNAVLTTVGNGQYAVQFSDGTDAMNSDGSRLILDINNADQFIAGFDNNRFE